MKARDLDGRQVQYSRECFIEDCLMEGGDPQPTYSGLLRHPQRSLKKEEEGHRHGERSWLRSSMTSIHVPP